MVGIRFGGSRDEILTLMQRLQVITPPYYKEQLLTSGAVGVLSPQPDSSELSAIYHTVERPNMETMTKVEDARGIL